MGSIDQTDFRYRLWKRIVVSDMYEIGIVIWIVNNLLNYR